MSRNNLAAFITAAEQSEVTPALYSDQHLKIRQKIENIITVMPALQICQQAVINLGLSHSILDFAKILKQVSIELNSNSLNSTLYQLRAILKQATKLKNMSGINESECRERLKVSCKSSQKRDNKKSERDEQQDNVLNLKKAFEEELAFRIKLNKFYSNDRLQRKQLQIKKKVVKAKTMNKKVMKVFQSYKEKQQRSYEFFKIQTIYTPPKVEIVKRQPIQHFTQIRDLVLPMCDSSMKKIASIFEKVQLSEDDEKQKTSNNKRRDGASGQNNKDRNLDLNQRFMEYRNRQLKTRERRKQLQREREQLALMKVIKKQQKIISIQQSQIKQQQKRQKKLMKQNQESYLRLNQLQQIGDFQNGIDQICQEKLFKKEMQLQQKVAKIREQLKTKQQRRERHRVRLQHKIQSIQVEEQTFYKSYQNFSQLGRDDRDRYQQRKIRTRHQMIRNKENNERIVSNIKRLTNQQICRSLEKIKEQKNTKTIVSLT